MKQKILKKIREIENKENVKVLFLVESGSRAWGWESKDSDYDIRGVYVQDYIKVFSNDIKRQINLKEGDLDIELWDFRKFLSLMYYSNPTVWEWISSDIVYVDNQIRKELEILYKENFRRYSLKKHYLSMARQNFNKYFSKVKDKANLKKYAYVLRSIACYLWVETNDTPPPKNYNKIKHLLSKEAEEFLDKIVEDKKESESIKGERNIPVEVYITSFFHKNFPKDKIKFNKSTFNKIFKETVKKYGFN